ncbi:MAG: helix-turn-helix domain-containing protein [Oscillospiraceae bacterium]|nr:helix-turn-helix domain-containing protein [Oscillospiraceae bacterium]
MCKKNPHSSAERQASRIYENIERLFLQRGMSLYQFAKEVEIPQTTVRSWKRGLGVPSVKFLIVIADYFDVSLDYLCGQV